MSIKLHGKEYIEVKDRVTAAHAEESYSMLKEETFGMGGREYVRVYIEVKGKQYIGTAECKFNANPKTPDGMSPFECGETSALGRALGFAGYGVVESIASADEVARNQPETAPNPTLKSVPAQPKLAAVPYEPTVDEIKALAYEIYSPKDDAHKARIWATVRSWEVKTERGDVPDGLLTIAEREHMYNKLLSKQQAKAS